MTSMYAQYLKEREGKEMLEKEHGFLTYRIGLDNVYIVDLYTVPEKRESGYAASMADEVASLALRLGKKYLTGSVSLDAPQVKRNTEVLLAYGFKPLSEQDNMIYFIKEL